jgi:hypothetical protein
MITSWQEIEIQTSRSYSIEMLQAAMLYLPREQVREGYEHYVDKWTWDDDSLTTRNLMLAFEAEHKHGPQVRMHESLAMKRYMEMVEREMMKAMQIPHSMLNGAA